MYKAKEQPLIFSSGSPKSCSNSPKTTSTFHTAEAQHALVQVYFVTERKFSQHSGVPERADSLSTARAKQQQHEPRAHYSQVLFAVSRDQECKPQRFGFIIHH